MALLVSLVASATASVAPFVGTMALAAVAAAAVLAALVLAESGLIWQEWRAVTPGRRGLRGR